MDENPRGVLAFMNTQLIKKLVIVGGGTAGWMAAAALSKVLRQRLEITLIESEEIGTVGVGEATIPMIQRFNKVLELDEAEFVRQTRGSFKLGIEFVGWSVPGERYIHGFGPIGQDLWTVPFDQYWRKLHAQGKAPDIGEFSITRVACSRNRFMPPPDDMPNSPLAQIAYAYHFDASLYAAFLRRQAEGRSVARVEGKVSEVIRAGDDGPIAAIALEDGRRIEGDFFVDCTGFRGLLIDKALQVPYEDWSHWLPCDRAIAVPCESVKPVTPYTRSTAREAGWQWRIPLQHRTGNGFVHCSRHISEDEATQQLLSNLDGPATAEPRTLRFKTGFRTRPWHQNCVAIGLSSGFLEPLESTSIHLIQTAIARLLDFFPGAQTRDCDIDEHNRAARFEWERIRDFIILHYHLNQRVGQPLWDQCREMAIPASLERRIGLYQSCGRIFRESNELFSEVGWLQVMHGQGLRPQAYHPLVDLLPEQEIAEYLQSVRDVIAKCVDVMPSHDEFLARL